MPTGNKRTNFADKRNLPQPRFKDTFFDYLAEEFFETAHRIWGSRRGVFGSAVLLADGADKFKVDSLPVELLDGGGHILILDAAAAEGIQFENSLGVDYYVAARHCLIPSVIERNPRNGLLDYDVLVDSIGVVGNPDAVAEVVGTLQFEVDSIFEAGVSHAGRLVTVWLSVPKSTDEAVAIERDLVVAWSGGKNIVTTAGLLGQGASAVSPVLTDYQVAATGLTVRRNTDLRTVDPFAFLGIVDGAGAGNPPTVFDVSDQIDVSSGLFPTLDLAYDGGPSGPAGSGRRIHGDAGAVWIETFDGEGSNDPNFTQLLLTRLDSAEWGAFQLQMICGDGSNVPIAALQPVRGTAGTKLQQSEPATLSGTDLITLTRGGVDLTDVELRINKKLHVVLVEGNDGAGLYMINSFAAGQITVRRFDNQLPFVWPAGAGTVRVLVPKFVVAGTQPTPINLDWWQGPLLVLRDGFESALGTLRVMPEGNGEVVVYDNSKSGAVTYFEPRELLKLQPQDVGQAMAWPFRFRRSVLVSGGDVSGAPGEESFYDRDGIRIVSAGGELAARDPAFPLVYDRGFPEDVPTFHTDPTIGFGPLGQLLRGHHFEDHFTYDPSRWTSAATAPLHYSTSTLLGGSMAAVDGSSGPSLGHGWLEVSSVGAVGSQAAIYSPIFFPLNTDYDFRWVLRARVALGLLSDQEVRIGFNPGIGVRYAYFRWDVGTLSWHLTYHDGAVGQDFDTGVGASILLAQWFSIEISDTSIFWNIERKDHVALSFGSWQTAHSTLSGSAEILRSVFQSTNPGPGGGTAYLDWWTWWDRELIYARLGNQVGLNHGP